jgi:hypothetical protein
LISRYARENLVLLNVHIKDPNVKKYDVREEKITETSFVETVGGRKTLLAIWWPESEYKPLPGNSLAAFKEAIDRRPHYRLHTGLNLALSADLERQRVVLVR